MESLVTCACKAYSGAGRECKEDLITKAKVAFEHAFGDFGADYCVKERQRKDKVGGSVEYKTYVEIRTNGLVLTYSRDAFHLVKVDNNGYGYWSTPFDTLAELGRQLDGYRPVEYKPFKWKIMDIIFGDKVTERTL